MNLFSCQTTLANVMTLPSHKSELHTQLLYGDYVKAIGEADGLWIPIELLYDGTQGWVLKSQLQPVQNELKNSKHVIITKDFMMPFQGDAVIHLVHGTILPLSMATNFQEIQTTHSLTEISQEHVLSILKPFMNTPYMWGGVTKYGIDCSGLSKIFYRYFAIHLPSVAAIQIKSGFVVDFLQSAQAGDLAFFENEIGEINHVGIMLNSTEILHASETNGMVCVDDIDQEGIYNRKLKKRTHKLTLIKRYLN